MKFNTVAAFCVALLTASLSCCVSNENGGNQPIPISISIWCTQDTPASYRVEYQRAIGAQSDVPPTQCIDMRESISYLKPTTVDVEYVARMKLWMVAIALNEKDASRVKSLIDRNIGKAMLVGVSKGVLSRALLASPMEGDKIFIMVDSEQAGLELKKRLILL